MADTQLTQLAPDVPSAAHRPTDGAVTPRRRPHWVSGLSRRTLVQGIIGSIGILVGSLGAGGDLIQDPILGNGPFSWIRYGHGRSWPQLVLYIGVVLLVWAWVRLGSGHHRQAGRATGRAGRRAVAGSRR